MKNLTKTILAVFATGLLSCGLFCQQAQAVTGTVTFGGSFHTDSDLNFSAATKFTSFPGITVSANPAPTGAYAGSAGTSATFLPFTFFPGLPGTVVDQWTFAFGGTTFTFDLEALTVIIRGHSFIHLEGTGTAEANGIGDSPATWIFDGNRLGGHFSITSTTTAAPDGGSAVALLGIGLVGIEALRRKFKAA